MSEIIVIAHNIRSSYNIGSIFRTCEGLGIKRLILSGYSPYPLSPDDRRLPHIKARASKAINKTAIYIKIGTIKSRIKLLPLH